MPLTIDEHGLKRQYESQGFFLCRGAQMNGRTADVYRELIRAAYDQAVFLAEHGVLSARGWRYTDGSFKHFMDQHNEITAFRELTRSPEAGFLIRELLGSGFFYITHSKISYKVSGEKHLWLPHQDTGDSETPFRGITLAVFLEDCDAENGTLEVFPASHKCGPLPHVRNAIEGEVFQQAVVKTLPPIEPLKIEARAGDILCFHPNMIHQSGENKRGGRRCIFFFEARPADFQYITASSLQKLKPGVLRHCVKRGICRLRSNADFPMSPRFTGFLKDPNRIRMALKRRIEALRPAHGSSWKQPLEVLRKKWVEVPASPSGRENTARLGALSDPELLRVWQKFRTECDPTALFEMRGWYQSLYQKTLIGKKVMDVGSGLALDSMTFAEHGAKFTFVDIVDSNLDVLRRVSKMLGIKDARFVHLQGLESLKSLERDYDAILALGSLHHAPFQFLKKEAAELVRHLKVGGRWIQLAYPKKRWRRDGCLPFAKWGERTDGPGTPWSEWYDLPKLMKLLSPAKFRALLYREYHSDDFNWFDLLYTGAPAGRI
ncbi:MAG: hypothetical protein A2Z83_05650 [Omnitrophica bacterium GWA2_52_8]|nr:MAG: hypothetical protein A2Z83_05650 [Omnitrophica bacterium GWA2_52_8]